MNHLQLHRRDVMQKGSGLRNSAMLPHAAPNLLLELEPWTRTFFRNLSDFLLRRQPSQVRITSAPALFWPDVFVTSRVPWRQLLESTVCHVLVITAVWSLNVAWLRRPRLVSRPPFSKADVIYYSPSEYLPPLYTGSTPVRIPQKGHPELAKQPIISVPPEADNRTQTIITPPNIKLTQDVPLPNIVAWHSPPPTVPVAATAPSAAQLKIPAALVTVVHPPPELNQTNARRTSSDLQTPVVAPPPDVSASTSALPLAAPQPAVIAPPPKVQGSIQKLGEMNIGHSDVAAPAPQLPVGEQPALSAMANANLGSTASQVVAPPPSVQDMGAFSAAERIIALGLHPTLAAPPVVAGNRRGTFAATPEGAHGAPGKPDIRATARGAGHRGFGNDNAGGAGSGSGAKLPPGLLVGAGLKNTPTSAVASDSPPLQPPAGADSLIADTPPMRVTVTTPHRAMIATDAPTPLEHEVFGDRKFYSMALNSPNLNSASGSWIIRFAELRPDSDRADLTAPEATQRVDPGYPLQLMHENVQGTVTLYAVIHRDGSVGDVRVLNSPDDRLDPYARAALSHWHFRPATRNGNPVALQAVVMIPFRTGRNSF